MRKAALRAGWNFIRFFRSPEFVPEKRAGGGAGSRLYLAQHAHWGGQCGSRMLSRAARAAALSDDSEEDEIVAISSETDVSGSSSQPSCGGGGSSSSDSDELPPLPAKRRRGSSTSPAAKKKQKSSSTVAGLKKLLSKFPWADSTTVKKVAGEARIKCRLCKRQMRCDGHTMLTHEKSGKHSTLVKQLSVVAYFENDNNWMLIVERCLHMGLSYSQILQLFTPQMVNRLNALTAGTTKHLLKHDIEVLMSRAKEHLQEAVDFLTLPFALMFDESNTKSGDGVTTAIFTNIEGHWMLEVGFLKDGTAKAYTAFLRETASSYGLDMRKKLVAVASDKCGSIQGCEGHSVEGEDSTGSAVRRAWPPASHHALLCAPGGRQGSCREYQQRLVRRWSLG